MTTSEFVQAVILKATGKATTLTSTDAKWIKIVAIGNRLIKKWEKEADWHSLYVPDYPVGTVTATNTFDLDDEVRKISDAPDDHIMLVDPDDDAVYSSWSVVNADRLKSYSSGNYVAQNGRTIRFNNAFTSTHGDFGRNIVVPVYLHAEPLTGASSEVPVDDPEWLVVMAAAEYVRNDITKQNQYPNLVAEANDIMEDMIEENDGQLVEVYRPWSAEY